MTLTSPCPPSLLFILLCLAPACAPERQVERELPTRRVVFLTDSTKWVNEQIPDLAQEFSDLGDRVLISGEPGETGEDLLERLPWLLQPGVDAFYYDENFAGPDTADSLRAALDRIGHPALLTSLSTRGATRILVPKGR